MGLILASLSCWSLIGPSVSPKSTVRSWENWRMPPPEPIDW